MTLQLKLNDRSERALSSIWIPRSGPATDLAAMGFPPAMDLLGLASSIDTDQVAALGNQTTRHSKTVPVAQGIDEKLFDSRVHLKVAVASYAMHLTAEDRSRLFGELDYLLEPEGWDGGDQLPSAGSFRQFLKWLVFTRDTSWSSLGIDDDGNVLVAWIRRGARMTANFGKRVRWTQRFEAESEVQLASGDFSLEHFARHSSFFLSNLQP